MNDPLIARFAAACGATAPLDLRVGLAEGGVLAEGTVHQPFTLVGRDDACDVTLNDPDVNPRHAWLQVVGGRVYALDLGSRAGLVWPDGNSRAGWLDPGTPVKVGPFRVRLRSPVSDRPAAVSPNPLRPDPELARTHPPAHLDFRNGKRARDRWTVNRAVTLVGRSDACKLHLHADDISAFHCGLVHTPDGLWVVDLSGRGVVVNGERMRVAPLPDGAELWIGRFLVSCRYPAGWKPPGGTTPPPAPHVVGEKNERADDATAATGPPTLPIPIQPLIAEDEVPLGGMPTHDPVTGLPSSHILAGAFPPPTVPGPISEPILVAGLGPTSGPTPPVIPVPPPHRPAPVAPPEPPATADAITPLLRHLAEVHGQMFDQFQQSLVLMARLCGQLRHGQSATVQQELAGIQELNAEMAKLQAEVARQALARATGGGPSPPGRPLPSDPTPLGVPSLPARSRTPDAADAICAWVQERLGVLQKERTRRWAKLTSMFAGDGG